MPNDLPDWTTQARVNLVGGISGVNLGDVAVGVPAADSGTETITSSQQVSAVNGVIASFKPAAGAVIAQVGALGAVANSVAGSVSPAFGQATTAGNLLTAWASTAGGEPTTAAAGWVKSVSFTNGGEWVAIWNRPNCGNAEAAPVFTSTGAGTFLIAQLGEFSGAATTTPTERTGSATGTGTQLLVAASAADAIFGDLVLLVVRWAMLTIATGTFGDAFNNGGTAVEAGSGSAISVFASDLVNHSYTIIPATAVPQPLGVAAWAYDATGTSIPAAGVAPSIVFAATAGKTYTLAMISAGLVTQGAAPADAAYIQVLDGVTVKFNRLLGVPAGLNDTSGFDLTGLALRGTVGNSMTVKFASIGAASIGSLSAGAYLR